MFSVNCYARISNGGMCIMDVEKSFTWYLPLLWSLLKGGFLQGVPFHMEVFLSFWQGFFFTSVDIF